MKKTVFMVIAAALVVVACAPIAGSPVPRFDTGVNPDSWVTVPRGEFLMGPHEHVKVIDYPYDIMTTEVTNAQYAKYLDAATAAGKTKIGNNQITGYYPGDKFHGVRHEEEIPAGDWLHLDLANPDLRLTYDGKAFAVKPGYENHPVTGVTWFGALAYCQFYGGNLPSEAEWEKAARGTEGRTYPWGNEISPANANYYFSRDPFEALTGKLGDTTPAGFYNGKAYGGFQTINSPSPYGAYDMAGNVAEWTRDVYEGIHYRYLRGGSKTDYGFNLRTYSRDNVRPDFYGPSIGFRMMRPAK